MLKLKAVAILVLGISYSYALDSTAFSRWNMSARAMGLNNNMVSLADDSNALFFNPAGLSNVDHLEVLLNGSKVNWQSSNISGERGCVAFSWPLFSDNHVAIGYTIFNDEDETALYREAQYVSGLSIRKRNLFAEGDSSLSFGVTLKMLELTITDKVGTYSSDPVFKKGKDTKNTGDVGALLMLGKLRTGISGNNIILADFGVLAEDKVPWELRIGSSYDAIEMKTSHVTPILEYIRKTDDSRMSAACEIQFSDGFVIRTGIDKDNISAGMSFGAIKPQCGRGTIMGGNMEMRIDLGYNLPINMDGQTGSFLFGGIFRF